MGRNKDTNGLGVKTRRVLAYIVLTIISFLCLIWFYILLINTTRSNSELTRGFTMIPSDQLIANIKNVINGTLPIMSGMVNSFIVAAGSAICSIYFSAMTAYSIHAYRFKGRKLIYSFILAIMMIPTQVNALGFIQLVDDMDLMNSFIPLIVPSIASPVTFFYIKQYLDSSLPLSLVEASRIDGSGEFKTFNKIVLPILKPALAVQAIFAFVGSWNNYFAPALILKDDSKKTLPILIAQLRSADFLKFDMGQVYAAITMSIFPVIIVYLILSKHIVQGVAVGSVKE